MDPLITTATSRDGQDRAARVAVLPVGSFEQHGDFLPLITDTVVACLIARRVSADYGLFLLPPVTVSCSHEHSGFAGTVSVSASTLAAVVSDVAESLRASGIDRLAIVNGHGGNYVLANVVQQANTAEPRMTLFPAAPTGRVPARRRGWTRRPVRTCTLGSWRSPCSCTAIQSWSTTATGAATGRPTRGHICW